jgi:putative ABC transport system permease protein
MLNGLLTDLRTGVRGLLKRPGFLIAAVATLAVGIGANATVFAFVDALLLRPLPFGDRSDRIVTLHSTHPTLSPDASSGTMSYAAIQDLPSLTTVFDGIAGYLARNLVLTGDAGAERVRGGSVTPGLFEVLSTAPARGRSFTREDAAPPGFEQVVMLSHGMWTRRYGGDPSLVGQSIQINERALTVIGVMPPGFRFPERDELWLPYQPATTGQRENRNLLGIAALRHGVSLDQGERELDRISSNLQIEFPETHRNWNMRVIPFRQAFVGQEAPLLLATLLGAVVFVLAIGCANLANLLLARGIARRREMSIRAAMGASRGRLIRKMMLEGLLVSVAGGAAGLLAATWTTNILVSGWPEDLPHWANVQIDARVVLFTVAASVAATVMFGLWPAYRAARPNVMHNLKETGPRSSGSRRQHGLQRGLVIAQIAMCMALLAGANMMIRSFMRLMEAPSGFEDSRMLSFRINLVGDRYDPLDAKTSFVLAFEEELRRIPGVGNAATVTAIPIDDGGAPQRVAIEGRTAADDDEIGASAIFISSSFFPALGLEPAEGRLFTQAETQNADADVAIVGRSFAREFWPAESAVGRRIGIRTPEGRRWLQIVGVAPDIQFEEFGEGTLQSRRNIYYPYGRAGSRNLNFMVSALGDPALLLNSIRETLRRVDPNLPVFELRTMAEVRASTTFEQRLLGRMMGVFAAIALFLACLGLYGVLAYSVRQRAWEMGLRIALGATSSDVARMVLGHGARTAATGIAFGTLLAMIVARIIRGVLYQVSPSDPVVFVSSALFLAAVVLLAVYLPARQAARIEPMAALRSE